MGCAAHLTSKDCKGPISKKYALPVSAEGLSPSLAACPCGLRCPLTSGEFEILSLWRLRKLAEEVEGILGVVHRHALCS